MRSNTIVCETEEQWLAERANSIGGSDSATVLGINPWGTALQLWQRFRGLTGPKPATEAMQMGHAMEPVIDNLVQKMGRKTADPGFYTIQRHPDRPFMHATLDRLIEPVEQYEGQGVGEYKNVGAHIAQGWEDGPPLYVQCQCQHAMEVTGLNWSMAAAIIGGNHFVWFDVLRNDKFIAYLIEQEREFWRQVEEGEPPEATAEDVDAVRLLYPDHTAGEIIQLDAEGIELTSIRDECRAQTADAKLADDAAKARLQQLIGTAEQALLPDGSGWSFKTHFRKAYVREVDESYIRTLRRTKTK